MGEIYLLRMKMVGDQVSIEGVEMFDLDKIDQYLKICFPNNASKIKEIKKELAKTDKKDVLKVVLQHGARGTVVTTGNVTFDIGPMKEILGKINIASSFDDNDGYTMESFGDEEGYTLEAPKGDKKPVEATPAPAPEEKPKADEKPKPEEKLKPEEKKAPSKPKKPWEKTTDEAKQEKKEPAWKKKKKPEDKPAEEKPKRPWEKKKDEPKKKEELKPEPKKEEPTAAPQAEESKPKPDAEEQIPSSKPAKSDVSKPAEDKPA